MAILTPIRGEIYKVKLSSGRTWLFKSAYYGEYITEHQGAYCIESGGNPFFEGYVSNRVGCHVGVNDDIISLKPANKNECAFFERKIRR